MKQEVLDILGSNNTIPAVFKNKNLDVGAIYTYENDVYCLKGGMDFPFDELKRNSQSAILDELKDKLFVFDNSYQG